MSQASRPRILQGAVCCGHMGLGPALLVRSYGGGERDLEAPVRHEDQTELGTRGQARWNELYVREGSVVSCGSCTEGWHAHATPWHHTDSGHDECFAQDGLMQRQRNPADSADKPSTRAPQNLQTATEIRLLVAVETDAQEVAQIKAQCAGMKQTAT